MSLFNQGNDQICIPFNLLHYVPSMKLKIKFSVVKIMEKKTIEK